MIARACAQRGRWFTDGPDFIDVPCSACRHLVESVDARGECDDCAHDPVRVAAREVADEDLVRTERDRELSGDEALSAWLDAVRDEALAHQLASEERPLPHRTAA